ncbi:MAG: hypothetical protein KBC30_10930 [Planctomycetes bacterium]|nr:hypothetical protein [Planctomycetota bacterium]HPY75488.1 hypothetical protein [Planctomycetota bacterium]HQB00328.1 hypothetical protein [Planctomycetota bacterium]
MLWGGKYCSGEVSVALGKCQLLGGETRKRLFTKKDISLFIQDISFLVNSFILRDNL